MQEDDRAIQAELAIKMAGHWALLFRLFVLATVGIHCLIAFLLYESRSQAEAKALTDGTNLAKVLERQLNTTLRRLDADLQGMAGRIRSQELVPQNAERFRTEWTTYLNALKVNFAEVKDFYVFDAKGDVLYTSGALRQLNIAERSHLKQLSAQPVSSMVWTDVVIDKTDGRPTIVFARGLRDTAERFVGIVSVTVDLDYFQRVIGAIDLGKQGLVAIRDTQANKLLIRQPPIPSEVNKATKSTNYDRIVNGEKLGHSVFTSPLDGETRYTTFLVLNDFPFFIYVAFGEDDVMAAWRSQLRISLAIAFAVLLMAGFALWRFWRAEFARQQGVAELVTARNTAEDAARKLELAYMEVRRTTTMLEHTGAIAQVGGWEVDLTTMKLTWTRETFRIAGIEPPNEPSLEDGINLFAPDARPAITAAVQGAMNSATPYDLQLPIISADGQQKWVRTQGYGEVHSGKVTRIYGTFQDITARVHAEQDMHALAERLSLAIRAGGIGIWDWDLVNDTLVWDNAMFVLYGVSPDQFGGAYAAWLAGVHPDDRARAAAECEAASQGIGNYDTEFRIVWPDGTVHTIRALANLQRGSNGVPVRLVGTNWDITHQKAIQTALKDSVRDKVALLMEVHHRVKNNLQVITSLLRLETHRSTLPQTKHVLKDMQGRIYAMAQLHASLYRSGTFASIDLGIYLGQIANQIFQTHLGSQHSVQLQLQLGHVEVGMDQAISCGLLVNELVSNCLKHAFPNNRSGEVRVELMPLAPDSLEAEAMWCLRVTDTGAGLPPDFEERRSTSLGLQLVGDLSKQAGGTLSITQRVNGGAEFCVVFKALMPKPLTMPVLTSA